MGSRILFLIRRLVGVTSRSSSLSMNSMHCSSDITLGGTSLKASSEADVQFDFCVKESDAEKIINGLTQKCEGQLTITPVDKGYYLL